jgi:transcriptional regulator with XRE-family HTH domain
MSTDDLKNLRADHAKAVGAALARMRRHAGLTQEELARRVGSSASWVVRLEGASRGADLADVMTWAGACGVDVRTALRYLAGDAPESADAAELRGQITAGIDTLSAPDLQLVLGVVRRCREGATGG